jgi:hypothetical protein
MSVEEEKTMTGTIDRKQRILVRIFWTLVQSSNKKILTQTQIPTMTN